MELNSVIHADVLTGLPQLPDECVQEVITSPPYWRLRQYPGVEPTTWQDGQSVCLGAEADPDSFVRHLVEVFAGVRRVLRNDGVLFVNLGETYAGSGKGGGGGSYQENDDRKREVADALRNGKSGHRQPPAGYQDGDRCGIPERFALAMQADGWTWRDTITWVKRSPMPMSRTGWRWMKCRVKVEGHQRDVGWSNSTEGRPQSDSRHTGPYSGAKWKPCPGCKKCLPNGGWVLRKGRFCTTAACEPIFMFVKGKEYFCDSEAASEPVNDVARSASGNKVKKWGNNHTDNRAAGTGDVERQSSIPYAGGTTRLPRSYFLLSNEPNREKHFAAYPTEIPKRLIEMGTSKAGCCPICRTCYAPVVESERVATRPGDATKCTGDGDAEGNRDPGRHVANTTILGYRPACTCPPLPPVPCVVLDPFAGTGTTLRVAKHLGRDWIGIEASANYLPIIAKNILRPLPVKKSAKVNGSKSTPKPMAAQQELFA
jgi:DNA modification methylase